MTMLTTLGRCNTQFSATCGIVLPVSPASSSNTSTLSKSFSERAPARKSPLARRLSCGTGWPRRILPVKAPPPSALHTTVPTC